MPSPVMASAEPEASPTSATLPAVTRRSLRVVVSAPRTLLSSARAFKMRPQRRQAGEDRLHSGGGLAGDGGHADFFRTDRGNVGLAQIAPMHLHHAGPRLHAVMTAGAESAAQDPSLAQAELPGAPGRIGHPRRSRSDRAQGSPSRRRGCFSATLTRLPQASRTPSCLAARNQKRMELQAANADAAAALEVGCRLVTPGKESDAVEGSAIVTRD